MDLILDWRVLGYEKDELWETEATSNRTPLIKTGTKTEAFLRNEFMPAVVADLQKELINWLREKSQIIFRVLGKR